jgi:hypothetical protein
MGEPALGTLDASNPAQVAEYEHHFYQAFAALTDNTLVRLIWDWDDQARRLRARIPYADQVIYCLRDDQGRLAAAMAVNLNPDAALHQAPPAGLQAVRRDGARRDRHSRRSTVLPALADRRSARRRAKRWRPLFIPADRVASLHLRRPLGRPF